MSNQQPHIISLPEFCDARGKLSFIEEMRHIPFEIGGVECCEASRLNASIRTVGEELIVVLSGKASFAVDNDSSTMTFDLDCNCKGLLVPTGSSVSLTHSSDDAVVLRVTESTDSTIQAPFHIRRVYFIADVPNGASRGGHAHKKMSQKIIAATGSFDITLNDGLTSQTLAVDPSASGTFVQPGVWRTVEHFSPGAVCLVLSSDFYDEDDYIRDYNSFCKQKR